VGIAGTFVPNVVIYVSMKFILMTITPATLN
jgi:hypothetical protein